MGRTRSMFLRDLMLVVALSVPQAAALAGNIDPDNLGLKYAYGENVGWINFKPSQGPGVTVTSAAVTGFAWGENIGWIDLGPAAAGVRNDGNGRLSGYAWSENVGWINFAPAGAGVFIDDRGRFFGKAWGENIGWISFKSNGAVPFGVVTSYRGQYSQEALAVPTLSGWPLAALGLAIGAIGTLAFRPRGVLRNRASHGD